MTAALELTVNGRDCAVAVPAGGTLLRALRDGLGLTGAKEGCDDGECGACVVLLDGAPVASCILLAHQAAGREVSTIEGVRDGEALHPLQAALLEAGAVQCGFCTPGVVMATLGTLGAAPRADVTEADVRAALAGNLCRCTGYQKIVEGVLAWAHETSTTTTEGDPHGHGPPA